RQSRAGDVTDLALMHEVVERAQGLLDRAARIFDVLIIEVDVIGIEAPKAGLDRGHDVAAGSALQPSIPVHRPSEFRRQHDLVAMPRQRAAEKFLRAALYPVRIGAVEKGDADIERLVDDRPRRRLVAAPAEIVAAEPDGRDDL